jgi:hypothetical protein
MRPLYSSCPDQQVGKLESENDGQREFEKLDVVVIVVVGVVVTVVVVVVVLAAAAAAAAAALRVLGASC